MIKKNSLQKLDWVSIVNCFQTCTEYIRNGRNELLHSGCCISHLKYSFDCIITKPTQVCQDLHKKVLLELSSVTDTSLPRPPLIPEAVLRVTVTDILLSSFWNYFLYRRFLRRHWSTFRPSEINSPLRFPLLNGCKFWRRHFIFISFPLGLEIVTDVFVEIIVKSFGSFLHLRESLILNKEPYNQSPRFRTCSDQLLV